MKYQDRLKKEMLKEMKLRGQDPHKKRRVRKRPRPNKPVMDVEKYYSDPWKDEDTSGPPPF